MRIKTLEGMYFLPIWVTWHLHLYIKVLLAQRPTPHAVELAQEKRALLARLQASAMGLEAAQVAKLRAEVEAQRLHNLVA